MPEEHPEVSPGECASEDGKEGECKDDVTEAVGADDEYAM